MAPERILLCVDDPARRRAFAETLGAGADLAVVGTTAADESAVRAAAARQPDLILVEARHAGVEGAKLVARLRGAAPSAGLLAVAAGPDRPRTVLARALVADRYVDPHVAAARVFEVVVRFARERRHGRLAS